MLNRRQVLWGAAVIAGAPGCALWSGREERSGLRLNPKTPLTWEKLPTEPFKGKQDDVFFVDERRGWYGNGKGKIFHTEDGGDSWQLQWAHPGTFVRCLGFVNEKVGFAGNIGPDYFPGVTDPQPLYRTDDGGASWSAVTNISGPAVKGVCAIDVLHSKFINSGILDERTVIQAAGRVGGPAFLLRSLDGGQSWRSIDLNGVTAMILDVKFFDAQHGVLCGGSDAAVEKSFAQVFTTDDGGVTWTKRYQSARPFENTWKCSFPTRDVGYVTVQNYDEDPKASKRFIAKTTDGGRTFTELPLVDDAKAQTFGVGFVDEKLGWVGALDGGFETRDGGETWTHVPMGAFVNKLRILRTQEGFVAYAIGRDLYRLRYAG